MATNRKTFLLSITLLLSTALLNSCGNSEKPAQKENNFELGQQALWAKDYEKGIDYLSRIPKSDPDYSRAQELITVSQAAIKPLLSPAEKEALSQFQNRWARKTMKDFEGVFAKFEITNTNTITFYGTPELYKESYQEAIEHNFTSVMQADYQQEIQKAGIKSSDINFIYKPF